MAPYSSILAGRIPRTGGLPSMGSQRVGHNRVSEHTHIRLFLKFKCVVCPYSYSLNPAALSVGSSSVMLRSIPKL